MRLVATPALTARVAELLAVVEPPPSGPVATTAGSWVPRSGLGLPRWGEEWLQLWDSRLEGRAHPPASLIVRRSDFEAGRLDACEVTLWAWRSGDCPTPRVWPVTARVVRATERTSTGRRPRACVADSRGAIR